MPEAVPGFTFNSPTLVVVTTPAGKAPQLRVIELVLGFVTPL